MVAVVAHLGGQVEGHREPGGALRKQVAIAPVAFFGGAEAGVLPHCPEAAAVHLPVDAAGVREFAWVAEGWGLVHDRGILRARRKEGTPKYSMRRGPNAGNRKRPRSAFPVSVVPREKSRYKRPARNPNITAKHMKKKPKT